MNWNMHGESGSHDYTINRKEAKDDLCLVIEKPDDDFYVLIKEIYDNIAEELELTNPYDPKIIIGAQDSFSYSFKRAIIESVGGGSHIFFSEGELMKQRVAVQPNVLQDRIKDNRQFEGWRYENE